MEPELVVHPQESGVEFLLGDSHGQAAILSAIMVSADPEGFSTANSPCINRPAHITEYFLLKRGFAVWLNSTCFKPFTSQLLSCEEGFPVNDGRVCTLSIVLLTLPVIPDLTGGQSFCGIGFLPERISNIPFIG